jgi:hypothetical protein
MDNTKSALEVAGVAAGEGQMIDALQPPQHIHEPITHWEEGLTEEEAAELQSVLDMSLVLNLLAFLVQKYKY